MTKTNKNLKKKALHWAYLASGSLRLFIEKGLPGPRNPENAICKKLEIGAISGADMKPASYLVC